MMHHVSAMLENCEYVRCLMIDFSHAFEVVNHVILLDKLSKLNLPDYIVNWIVSFLTDHTQAAKVGDKIYCQRFINRGTVQDSDVGPTFYVVMESNYLKPLSSVNVNLLCKFADDTNLLVPANSDIDIVQEFQHIKQWSMLNNMLINMSKTKEIVFHRPSIKHFLFPAPISNVAQVSSAKLLGVILQNNLHFDEQITDIIKICSQRSYLLKMLRDQGLCKKNMYSCFSCSHFV